MRKMIVTVALFTALACGKDATAPIPPVEKGSIQFSLEGADCASYATAQYFLDSLDVGTEPIVAGALSKSYTVPAGRRSAVARLTKPGSSIGLWTFRDVVTVPVDGSVIAHLAC